MVLQCDVHVKAVCSVRESHPDVSATPTVVHDLDDEVTGAVSDRLHGHPRVGVHGAGCEQLARVLVLQLEADLPVGLHDPQAARPVRGGKVPVGGSVAPGGLAGRNFVHKHLKHSGERESQDCRQSSLTSCFTIRQRSRTSIVSQSRADLGWKLEVN